MHRDYIGIYRDTCRLVDSVGIYGHICGLHRGGVLRAQGAEGGMLDLII